MSTVSIKGQLILKAVDFPKKRTDEFDLFAFLVFTVNKSNSFVHSLGEYTARQSAFWFFLTFTQSLNICSRCRTGFSEFLLVPCTNGLSANTSPPHFQQLSFSCQNFAALQTEMPFYQSCFLKFSQLSMRYKLLGGSTIVFCCIVA